jgi:hypothetical protein
LGELDLLEWQVDATGDFLERHVGLGPKAPNHYHGERGERQHWAVDLGGLIGVVGLEEPARGEGLGQPHSAVDRLARDGGSLPGTTSAAPRLEAALAGLVRADADYADSSGRRRSFGIGESDL